MNQLQLNIGDEIGIPVLASDIDEADRVIWAPVVSVTEVAGTEAYIATYPDGTTTRPIIANAIGRYYTVRRKAIKTDGMICLTERKEEFATAVARGIESDLSVFDGWDRDEFFVINQTAGTEYKVRFVTANGAAWAECECSDFTLRRRICKHQAAVLTYGIFGV